MLRKYECECLCFVIRKEMLDDAGDRDDGDVTMRMICVDGGIARDEGNQRVLIIENWLIQAQTEAEAETKTQIYRFIQRDEDGDDVEQKNKYYKIAKC